tara:strand:- start:40 stop:591 length:552 start_codon:yes stop_codon:yes gene_type:complete
MLRELSEEFRKFGKYVVQQSRTNLTKQKHNVTKNLYDSLGYELSEPSPNLYDLTFYGDDYATFLDKGVRGADPSLVKNGRQKGAGSPYSYKNKKPPMQPLADWAKKRNIRLRDKKGRFKKGNYRTIGFILQRSIFAQGIAPTMFFTKPFLRGVEIYTPLLQAALGRDIDELIRINVALQKQKK